MTPTMNQTLARHFDRVHASRGARKCRVLHAAGPRPSPARWPRRAKIGTPDGSLAVVAHGATFAGTRLDAGTRLLLEHAALHAGGGAALDLGCGSGILAATLARSGWTTTATDVSTAAVAATALTASANGVDVTVAREEGLGWAADASFDLIVTNPPFHVGTAKDSTPTLQMFGDAARVLRPGGVLWAVWNAHLPYLTHLRRHTGPTEIVARDRAYVVTRTQPR